MANKYAVMCHRNSVITTEFAAMVAFHTPARANHRTAAGRTSMTSPMPTSATAR